MKIKEVVAYQVNEAGLIGKLGSAVGKAATSVATKAAPALQKAGQVAAAAKEIGSQFKKGVDKWQGTGVTGGPNKQALDAPETSDLAGEDPDKVKQIMRKIAAKEPLDQREQEIAARLSKNL